MGTTQPDTSNDNTSDDNSYVEYDPCDVTYFGAKKIVDTERDHVERRRKYLKNANDIADVEKNLTGLALSGGGIRSASFCLGVLQALSYRNVLKKVDYLSTVSGGGYIGSSLTWLLSRTWYKKPDKKNESDTQAQEGEKIDFDVDRKNFPYGTYPMLGQVSEPGKEERSFSDSAKELKHRGALLRFLRQHGKYLTPGHGINGFSLLGVILRGSILSIFIYFSMLVLVMTGLEWVGAFNPPKFFAELFSLTALSKVPNYSILLGLVGLVIFVLSAPIYSLIAYRQSKRKNGVNTSEATTAKIESKSYKLRRRCEIIYNYLLLSVAILAVIGLIPVAYDWLNKGSDFLAGLTGAISTAIGFISSISAYIKTSSNKKGIIPVSLLVLVGTIALWFGLLLLAYHCSLIIGGKPVAIGVLAGLAVLIGWKANLNYISVHRYYRDRLMETFMPDVPEVLDPAESPQRATSDADKARLSTMCGYRGKDEHLDVPYHIINTNLVLVSSRIAKFKGRGGDNFILTPAYCGSNATGWQQTDKFMGNRMTLPTAMAISGAAVNPSTGVGGDGITRQPFLSMLMGFLNIRLGYWATHPNPAFQSNSLDIPNFFRPGFSEMFFRRRLKEDCRFLQLSDGGHFENLGIYELIRRKSNIIICCDGAADPNYEFTDLSNALEKIRADFGVLIEIPTRQLDDMVPKKRKELEKSEFATRGFIVAKILYPDRSPGIFIYIKSTFFDGLSADLYGYKQTHKEFPDEPTSDHFSDEKQFEAYRELGYQTAWKMMIDDSIKSNPILKTFFEAN